MTVIDQPGIGTRPSSPLLPAGGTRTPFALHEFHIAADSFWGARQALNATTTLEHCYHWMRRMGWIGNFEAAAEGALPAARRGREFTDSDVYKLLEAMIWENGRQQQPSLHDRINELVTLIGGAQEPDGYLNTMFGRIGQAPRYSDLEWGHELYDYGHLLQAAVAEIRTAGPGALTTIATRAAEHVCAAFGPAGRAGICGHPEIELALIEFARATGQDRYRRQAKIFLERRGHGLLHSNNVGAEYWQDDVPIHTAAVLRGHAVRATYLAAAAADLALDDDDADLLAVLETQWRTTTARRTYLTGGMGSRHEDEAFGADFELPSEHAYSETCAAVGALMWSWRMLMATGTHQYADFAERLLYNVVATSPSSAGTAFYYSNTLHQRTPTQPRPNDEASSRASSSARAPWFDVSCCPPNIARTLATLASYCGWKEHNGITLSTYTAASVHAVLASGANVRLIVEADYPDSGTIRIAAEETGTPYNLTLRIPRWADGAVIRRANQTVPAGTGWTVLEGVGATDEVIELVLPMHPRITNGDPRIDSVRGAIAVERGPIVYCLESTDINGTHVDEVVADTSQVQTIDGRPVINGWTVTDTTQEWPYGPPEPRPRNEMSLPLTPYHAWGERGSSTMRVWIRTE